MKSITGSSENTRHIRARFSTSLDSLSNFTLLESAQKSKCKQTYTDPSKILRDICDSNISNIDKAISIRLSKLKQAPRSFRIKKAATIHKEIDLAGIFKSLSRQDKAL